MELERLAPVAAPAQSDERSGAPRLLALLDEARPEGEAARRELGDQVNRAVQRLARGGSSESTAQVLLKLLARPELKELVDTGGRSCRAEATRALLELGWPWALHVHPDDLEHLRRVGSPRGGRALWIGLAVGGPALLAAGLAAAVVSGTLPVLSPLDGALLAGALAIYAGAAAWGLWRLWRGAGSGR